MQYMTKHSDIFKGEWVFASSQMNKIKKKNDNIFFQVNCYNFLKVRWISRQMTMILMYVSSQTVP